MTNYVASHARFDGVDTLVVGSVILDDEFRVESIKVVSVKQQDPFSDTFLRNAVDDVSSKLSDCDFESIRIDNADREYLITNDVIPLSMSSGKPYLSSVSKIFFNALHQKHHDRAVEMIQDGSISISSDVSDELNKLGIDLSKSSLGICLTLLSLNFGADMSSGLDWFAFV